MEESTHVIAETPDEAGDEIPSRKMTEEVFFKTVYYKKWQLSKPTGCSK